MQKQSNNEQRIKDVDFCKVYFFIDLSFTVAYSFQSFFSILYIFDIQQY